MKQQCVRCQNHYEEEELIFVTEYEVEDYFHPLIWLCVSCLEFLYDTATKSKT